MTAYNGERLECYYSAARYSDGSVLIMCETKVGPCAVIGLSSQEKLKEFIEMLKGCLIEQQIPKTFKDAFQESEEEV